MTIDRKQLAKILQNDQDLILRFEKLFRLSETEYPDTMKEIEHSLNSNNSTQRALIQRLDSLEKELNSIPYPTPQQNSSSSSGDEIIIDLSRCSGTATASNIYGLIGAAEFTGNQYLYTNFIVPDDYAGATAYPSIHFLVEYANPIQLGQVIAWRLNYNVGEVGHTTFPSVSNTLNFTYTGTGNEVANEYIIHEAPTGIDLVAPGAYCMASIQMVNDSVFGNIFGLALSMRYK